MNHSNASPKHPSPPRTGKKPLAQLAHRPKLSQLLAFVLTRRLAGEHLHAGRRPLAVFSFDLIGGTIQAKGIYEERELALLGAWLATCKGGQFKQAAAIDIGANVGNHALILSDSFRTVHAFEPNPRTFELLRLNCQLVDNVKPYCIALADFGGMATMQFEPANIGGAKLLPEALRAQNGPCVEVRSLDRALKDDGLPVRLIKIDVEGGEAAVLRGARRLVQAHQPIIVFEQNADISQDAPESPIRTLRDMGYQHFASVSCRPRLWPSRASAGGMLARLMRLLTGEVWTLSTQSSFPPANYRMIVAVPDWAKPANTADPKMQWNSR